MSIEIKSVSNQKKNEFRKTNVLNSACFCSHTPWAYGWLSYSAFIDQFQKAT